MDRPKIIIIGGANGSGKTTLAREYVTAEKIEYLSADDIARQLNEKKPEAAAIDAAQRFSQIFNDALKQHRSLIIESTLSGLSLQKQIAKARQLNYSIEIVFVYLDSVELCIQRVASRVASGGHNVPASDIRRRFDRANRNFWYIYKHLADEWNLFFNAVDSLQQIAAADQKGVIIYVNQE